MLQEKPYKTLLQITELDETTEGQNGVENGFRNGYNESYLNVLASAAYSQSQMQNSTILAQIKKNGYEM